MLLNDTVKQCYWDVTTTSATSVSCTMPSETYVTCHRPSFCFSTRSTGEFKMISPPSGDVLGERVANHVHTAYRLKRGGLLVELVTMIKVVRPKLGLGHPFHRRWWLNNTSSRGWELDIARV
eukprot:gnl/MRDRNA2_/MRDRNA2_559408_c0_seq1.p1 gnl/MRDRNA2_/MRDRNA2_559408_c0~~gnl/MRDRNA2_/MRDRNA2_559408_c0_seq1.p1  ORF type:complete len:122 (+),score=5.92 gnl/MRDRNA2_/MRDRNA2_559408_c0_seq1:30-395(+)